MNWTIFLKVRTAETDKGLVIAGITRIADTFVLDESAVLRLKLNANKARHRKPQKRLLSF